MIGVGWPRKTIDAAVLAAAVGVDRAVEPDVGRAVAGEDRLGTFDSNGRPALRHAVQRFNLIEPLSLHHPLLKVEACGGRIAGGAAATVRLDWHGASLRRQQERNKNGC